MNATDARNLKNFNVFCRVYCSVLKYCCRDQWVRDRIRRNMIETDTLYLCYGGLEFVYFPPTV